MTALWALEEVGGADLGDARLDRRFARVLSDLGSRPNASIPAASLGRSEIKAAYRFFDNERTTLEKILEPHIAQTKVRMSQGPVVLLVQDTTEIDLTRPESEVVGAGDLDGSRRGVQLHEMQAFTTQGVPLGTVWAELINRPDGVSRATTAEKQRQRKRTPIEEKESVRWLHGLRQGRAIAQELEGVQCVCVADSEADIYELFVESRGEKPVHWLIRACQDRALQGGSGWRLREKAASTPPLYEVELLIRGRHANYPAEERTRRLSRETRKATVEVRAARVTLRPPLRPDRKLPPVTVNVILARETNPPAGESAVEWILVTTLPIDTAEQVREVVRYYCVRWCIEVFFRTLKSGCRIERRRFEHIDRLLPCLGLFLIVAWRVLFVCRLGRSCPDMDCEAVFEPSEWKAVWSTVKRSPLPSRPPRLAEMVHLVANLGGYIERPRSEPGTQTLWIGIQRMHDLAWAWDTFGPGAPSGCT